MVKIANRQNISNLHGDKALRRKHCVCKLMYCKGLLVRSRIARCSSAIAAVMYINYYNYIVNVCIMRMQEIVYV